MELTLNQALHLGVAAHKEGNHQEAERLYRAILQSQPTHPDANHNLGVLVVSLNKSEAALPLFKTALETNPNVEQFWVSYIDALIKENQFENAQAVLTQGTTRCLTEEKVDVLRQQLISATREQAPSRTALNNLLAHYQNGRYEDAEKSAISITTQYPHHQYGWKVLGLVLKRIGRISEALVANQKAVEIAPKDAESHYNLGNTLRELGRLDKAEASYNKAIALQPDYTDAHNNVGITLEELGRLEEAEASYRKVTLLQPAYSKAHSNLGNALRELGRLNEAEASCRKAIALQPDFAEFYNNLGNTLQDLSKFEEAEASYSKAIALRADYTEAHNNLGLILKNLDRFEEAEASFSKAIALKPDYYEAHNNFGVALLELGRIEAAEATYRKVIALKPEYAEAHSNYGNTLMKLGRIGEAEASYRKAIALKPDYFEAHSNLGNTLKDFGRFEEAEASYRKAIALKSDNEEVHYSLGLLLVSVKKYELATEQFQLSKLEKSKRYLLRCLYHQDEQLSFFDLLDCFINQGEIHPMIGSLACRAALRYGIEKQNLFCKNPLDYVLKVDLNNQYDFGETFVKTARTVLSEKRLRNRRQGLLSQGYQTFGNVFDLEPEFTNDIQKAIRLEIEKYRVNFKDSEEGLITSWPTNYTLYGWFVSMESGGELAAHMHEKGWISGSIYINVPTKSKIDSGNLVVCIEEELLAGVNGNQSKSIDVVTGNLCLFPASLLHYTIPFESEEERIVLAFDVVPAESKVTH
jgi:tetratricopeptide (TPR) repeat protein